MSIIFRSLLGVLNIYNPLSFITLEYKKIIEGDINIVNNEKSYLLT